MVWSLVALSAIGSYAQSTSRIIGDNRLSSAQSLPLILDTAWDSTTEDGWQLSGGCLTHMTMVCPRIITDATAPHSPSNVLKLDYTNVAADSGPGNMYNLWPGKKEVYEELWIKLSSDWRTSPAGVSKTHYTWNGPGSAWFAVSCNTTFGTCPSSPNDTNFKMCFWIQWTGAAPDNQKYGDAMRCPNVTTTIFNRNEWVKIGTYFKEETTPGSSRDGIVRFWVNDTLNGEYTTLSTPGHGWNEYHLDAIVQSAVTNSMFMEVDALIVRGQ